MADLPPIKEVQARCNVLKVGKCKFISRLLDEIAQEGLESDDYKKGYLTKVNLSAKEIIEKKLQEPNLDPWGEPLPF